VAQKAAHREQNARLAETVGEVQGGGQARVGGGGQGGEGRERGEVCGEVPLDACPLQIQRPRTQAPPKAEVRLMLPVVFAPSRLKYVRRARGRL